MLLCLQRILSALALFTTVGIFAVTVSLTFAPAAHPEPTTPAAAPPPEQVTQPEPQRRTPPPTKGERAVEIALEAVGVPYRWGGESPESGFDCSGLVRWAYGRVGIDVPHSSYALYSVGRQVSPSRMEEGDLLFFTGLGHVGLYIGHGLMVHAPQSGKNVEVVPLRNSHYGRRLVGARRVA
jgi:cell wall-associated NlpC family hydrolase